MDLALLLLLVLASQLFTLSLLLPWHAGRYCAALLAQARQQLPAEVAVPAKPPKLWNLLHLLVWLAALWPGWQLWTIADADGTGPQPLSATLRTMLFGLLALQVLLLAGQRRWLSQLAASLTPVPARRVASLLPRRLGLFVSPLRLTLLVLATALPPLLALLLWQGALWPKPLAVLWQLCLFTALTDVLLAGVIAYAVYGPAPQRDNDTDRQQQISTKVRRYSNAWLAFNTLVCVLMLQSLLGARPALLYLMLSGAVQLLLLSSLRRH